MSTDALATVFPSAAESNEVRTRLQELLDTFGLDIDDLHVKWEAYATNRSMTVEDDDNVDVTPESLDLFRGWLLHTADRPRKKPRTAAMVTPARAPGRLAATGGSSPGSSVGPHSGPHSNPNPVSTPGNPPYTPGFGEESLSRTPRSELKPLNASLDTSGVPLVVEPHIVSDSFKYRPMFQKLSEISRCLDDQVEATIERLLESHGLQRSDVANPAHMSQSDNLVVGRILTETSDSAEVFNSDGNAYEDENDLGPLDNAALVLEASRRIGAGVRVPLDISALRTTPSFFRGQVAAFKGSNPTGQRFVVSEIVSLPRLSPPSSALNIDEHHDKGVLRILIAAGPFTSRESLDYTALRTTLTSLSPDCSMVLLMGPLVDDTNPGVQQGTHGSPEVILATLIRPLIADIQKPIVYIPSIRDATSAHPVFPQPALDKLEQQLGSHVVASPNPACIDIAGLQVVATSIPAVQDIVATSSGKASQATAFQDVLWQRRLYPIYPPVKGVSIDYGRVPDLETAPNVLVVPGAEPSHAISGGVVCISPGSVANGTCAMLSIIPPISSSDTRTLPQRTKVDILSL